MEKEPLLFRKFHQMIQYAHENTSKDVPKRRTDFRNDLLIEAGYYKYDHIELEDQVFKIKIAKPLNRIFKEDPRKVFHEVYKTINRLYVDLPEDFISRYL